MRPRRIPNSKDYLSLFSTLPTITSNATALTTYNFYDTISEGLSYDQAGGVKIEIFTDKDCTDKVTTWDMQSGKFGVSYSSDDRHMTVDITQAGLDEINGRTENVNGSVYMGLRGRSRRSLWYCEDP